MKKILLVLVLFTGMAKAQIVSIPDAILKAKLISLGHDTNSDGQIQYTEAAAITTYISIQNLNISDLTGIEAYINCQYFSFVNNNIAVVTLSNMPNVIEFDFMANPITSINLSAMPSFSSLACINLPLLTGLDFSGIPTINTLDVSNCPSIISLNLDGMSIANVTCGDNTSLSSFSAVGSGLSSLNLNQLPAMQYLNVSNCPGLHGAHLDNSILQYVNLSGCTNLYNASFQDNSITTFDVTGCINLSSIYLRHNQLTSLDTSTNIILNYLEVSDNVQLSTILIKNGSIESLSFSNCPNLSFICADEAQVSALQSAAPTAMVSSYCTFVPGGNYNSITGSVIFDSNNNGCNSNDFAPDFVRMNVSNGTISGATFTNSAGNYTLYASAGTYTLSPSVPNAAIFNFSPASATINFPLDNSAIQNQNFCVTANGIHPDLEVVLIPLGRARPGFDCLYKIVYKNKGNQILSGTVSQTYDDAITDFLTATPAPDTQSPGLIVYNYSNLHPFESRSVFFSFHINAPTDTPAVNSGDILAFTSTITPIAGDETPEDNTFHLNQTVVNSLDPNDKTCLEGITVSSNKIGDYLHYNINFENTGSASAINIVVKDIIDTAKFDIRTLQLMYASHPVDTKITGNKVEFVFENINLPAIVNNKGNVMFKIKTKSNLVIGNSVSNKADIYFDYNFPIATNTETSTFTALSNSDFIEDKSVMVSPNPATDNVTVSAKSNLRSVSVYDIQGRVLQTVVCSENRVQINLVDQSKGVYFLKIVSEAGSRVEKIVKR